MEQILFSVLVPLYNTEKYIEKCINSILNQTYKNLELIVINDGSTDNSLNLVKKIDDNRIKVITQDNVGIFETRINLLNQMNGNYFLFCDADDYLEENYLQTIYDHILINKSDCYIIEANIVNENNQITSKDNNILRGSFDLNGVITKFLETNSYNSIWRKVFVNKRNYNFESIIKYREITMGDDVVLSFFFFKECNNVTFIKEHLYNYRILSNSMTRRYNNNAFLGINYIYEIVDDFMTYKKVDLDELNKTKFLKNILSFMVYPDYQLDDKSNFIESLKLISKNDLFILFYNEEKVISNFNFLEKKLLSAIKKEKYKRILFIKKILGNKKINKFLRKIARGK